MPANVRNDVRTCHAKCTATPAAREEPEGTIIKGRISKSLKGIGTWHFFRLEAVWFDRPRLEDGPPTIFNLKKCFLDFD
jgi:hypothetical protein